MFWLTQIIYKLVICLTKVSFLIFYLKVFPQGQNKYFMTADYAIMAFVILYSLASVGATIGQCQPVSYAWDKTLTYGSCINLTAFWFANAVASISTDLMIILLPCTVCFRLKISRNAKAGLFLVFSVGFL